MELDVNGRFHLPGREEQIAFFEKFLEAIKAGHGAVFTQTDGCLELEVCEENHLDDRERQRWIKLLRRTLLILREGLGVLVATKTGSNAPWNAAYHLIAGYHGAIFTLPNSRI